MTQEQMINWIDNATYEELLRKWRFEPIGSPWFTGEVADHFDKVMRKKQIEISREEHTKASKEIGWGD